MLPPVPSGADGQFRSTAGRAPRVRAFVPHLALVWLLLLIASPATGQPVASNFEELRLRVKAGDTVCVTDDSGKPERKARILDLSASSLVVSLDGARRELIESRVTRIRRRVPDSRKNGALIGFLAGGAAATGGAVATASPSGSCTGGCVGINVLFGGGVGALVGLGIDARIKGRRDIYVRDSAQSSRGIHLTPFASSQAKGLTVSLRY